MKQLLAVILFSIGFNCTGQITTSSGIPTTVMSPGTATLWLHGSNLPIVDTERVIMLVQDTTLGKYPYMMKGYFAKERSGDKWNESFWMVVSAVLDNNKKPISKNIVIWETITIK